MRQSILIATVTLLSLSSSFAQPVSSRYLVNYSTSEQVDSLLASLADRSKNLPTGEYQVYTELRWIDDQLSSIANNLARGHSAGSEDKSLKALKQQWSECRTNIVALKSEDFEGIKDLLENKYVPLLSSIEGFSFRRDTDGLSTYQEFDSLISKQPLKRLLERGDYVSPTKEQSTNIVQVLQQKLVLTVDSLIAEFDQQTKNEAIKREQLNEKLQKAQTELQSYRQKILDQRQKAETKQSLRTNLYLMILVIGGLSIGAIALVRWFPDNVMMEWVESGQVIQFVTVMILLSVIMALGLAGLLTENTLGTLLGGIGGYVLSQGVGRSAARRAIREMSEGQRDARGANDLDKSQSSGSPNLPRPS